MCDQCCNQGTGDVGQWIQSQGGAGGQMARSGDAQGTWWPGTSIASATCTVAATVQESMWKSPHPPPLLLLGLFSKPITAPLIIIILLQLLLLLHPLLKWLMPLLLLFPRLRLPLIFFSSIKGNPLLCMNLSKIIYDLTWLTLIGYMFVFWLLDLTLIILIRVPFIGGRVRFLDKDRFLVGSWGKLGQHVSYLGELLLILYKLDPNHFFWRYYAYACAFFLGLPFLCFNFC